MTRSMASSRFALVIHCWFWRAVSSAASFSTLARSAPVKPGVRLATVSRSTSGAIGLLAACTRRICRRPFMSGASTGICRSKRPGRSSAGSSTSGRLVAAIMHDAVADVEAVHLDSSWFSVCSRSSWPPPMPAPRWRPTASISSMKMMAGACFFACSNRSRTRRGADADEHLDEVRTGDREERHARLARTARASSVLPVPGGPYSSTPLGMV
jgi:hypothetical protein